ncbi:hypothetical protein SESBI_06088 [Sesbania bispinosa]|nr:hypothetical protein SESBI_06088 [Sesbania bispinosa]
MENRVRLGVQKKKPIKRRGRKPSLNKFFDYLKSDTFMYASLLSSRPSDFPSTNTFPFSAQVVELKNPIKESQLLQEQVGDYLKSDVYMYEPLLDPPPSPQEPIQDCGVVRMDVSSRRLTMKVNQPNDHLGNVNQLSESNLPQTDLSDKRTRGHMETVKHTVYQSCRSTSASRNVTLNSQLRAHS